MSRETLKLIADLIAKVEDASHAANAKARAKQMLNRGSISQAEYDKICAKADKVLAE